MPDKLPRVKPGDAVTAEAFNALIDVANQCGLTVAESSGLTLYADDNGYVLGTALSTYYWAKTTGAISGGKYPFTQQIPDTAGAWTAGSLTGTAYETTGNTSVATGTYVKIFETVQGDWRFTASQC